MREIIVRVINPAKKLVFFVPVPVSQIITFAECPSYTFAVHRPVVIENNMLVTDYKSWCISEAKTGLKIVSIRGTRESTKEKAIAIFARAKAFYKEADFIERGSAHALSQTADYKEGTFTKC